MNLRPLAPHANALAKLRYTQMICCDGFNPLKLEIGLLEFFDPMAGAILNNLFETVAWIELEGSNVDGDRRRENDPVPEPFHFKIGVDRVFFTGHIGKSDQIVLSQVFQ